MRLERSRFVDHDRDNMAAHLRFTDGEQLAGHGVPDGSGEKMYQENVSDDIPKAETKAWRVQRVARDRWGAAASENATMGSLPLLLACYRLALSAIY